MKIKRANDESKESEKKIANNEPNSSRSTCKCSRKANKRLYNILLDEGKEYSETETEGPATQL